MTVDSIKEKAKTLQNELVEWRRHFHRNPEVGLEVPETAAYVTNQLKKMGFQVRTGVGGHGVVGLLKGYLPGKTIAIRSDMDALPIKEETGLPFTSEVDGMMHACGHDAHMAMALGSAKILSENKDKIRGNIKFLFQPAEEGPGGAKPMIEDGALKNPKVDAIIGLHTGNIWKGASPGDVYISHGPMMACMDQIDVTIKGKSGHGAMPHLTVDAISMASHVISSLQTIISREINPVNSAVITIGKIEGGSARNIISNKVTFEGTVRAFSQEHREFIDKRIKEIIKGVTSAMRGGYEYLYTYGYPPLVNDPGFTEQFAKVAKEAIGPDRVREIPEPSMAGEDMAYFLKEVPGTFFFLEGCNAEMGQIYPHHSPKFDIDENILWIGSALFSAMAIKWME